MKKYNLRDDTMKESELKMCVNYLIYPRGSETTSNKGFVIIDKGQMFCTHWTCFYMKVNKSFYLDSFGVYPDNFSLQPLPKPIIYHKHKI